MKFVNIKLWDILGCFHYILNAPRTLEFRKCLKRSTLVLNMNLDSFKNYETSVVIIRRGLIILLLN